MTEALTVTISSATFWPFIGKLVVSAAILFIVGGLGLVACVDDSSWPNQLFRAFFVSLAVFLVFCVWVWL